MKYEIGFHPSASEEVVAIKRWYMERSDDAAGRFDEELTHAVDIITGDPFRWRERRPGVRHYVFHRFPFYIAYRILGEVVEIIAVAHGRRRPGYWTSRLGI